MKKRRFGVKAAVWVLVAAMVPVFALPSADMHVGASGEDVVALPHLHSGSGSDGSGCYTVPVYHIHAGSSDAEGGCYTVPVPHVHTGSPDDGSGCYTAPVYHWHEGSPDAEGGCYTVPVYHTHTGSSSSGGGCYTVPISCGGSITAKTESSYCGSLRKWWGTPDDGILRCYASCNSCGQFWDHTSDDYGDAHYRSSTYYSCNSCGTRYSGTGTCTKTVRYNIGCGKEGTVESYALGCGKTTSTVDSYSLGCGREGAIDSWDLGCNKDESTIESYELGCGQTTCGSIRAVNHGTGFATQTELSLEVLSEGAGCTVAGYSWSDGGTGQSVTVSQNGTYTCTVTYVDNYSGETGTAQASVSVQNVDVSGPEISSVSQSETGWTKGSVTLSISASDPQSGLPGDAYSWNDSGWQGSTEYTVSENGTYEVKVRDELGNETSHVFVITNIDTSAPDISASQSETGWTNKPVVLSVSAEDTQSGLPGDAYAWDGGDWQSGASREVSGNGTYEVKVRDNLGNEVFHTFEVNNIDTVLPEVSVSQSETEWTNSPVTLFVSASDGQSGLSETAYDWNGEGFQGAPSYGVTQNGSYELKVRDKAGNEVSHVFEITNIDTTAPEISVDQSVTGWTNGTVMLSVMAEDSQSGMPEDAYDWDGGGWQSETEYAVTRSGSYELKVRDNLGNEISHVFEITNIDVDGPVISVSQSETGWTKDPVTLTVLAEDVQSGMMKNAYNWNDTGWKPESEYTVAESGSYELRVRDRLGNETVHVFEVMNIDTQAPDLSPVQSETEWTNQDVVLTVDAEDAGSGLPEDAYNWNDAGWDLLSGYTAEENGTYGVRVRDSLGNEVSHVFEITNIDRGLPVIESCTLSPDKTTYGPVSITVSASDELSGLAAEAYSLDGETWQEDNVFTVSHNGRYNVYVRDAAGNVASLGDAGEYVMVSNIMDPEPEDSGTGSTGPSPAPGKDMEKPVVSVKLSDPDWTDGTNKIIVSASDEELADKPYSYDGGQTWTDDPEYEITQPGTYIIFVRDAAGNIEAVVFNAVKPAAEPVHNGTGSADSSVKDSGESRGDVFGASRDRDTESDRHPVSDGVLWGMIGGQATGGISDGSMSVPNEGNAEEEPPVTIMDNEVPESPAYEDASGMLAVLKAAIAVLGVMVCAAAVAFLVLYFGSFAVLYTQDASGSYRWTGIVRLYYDNGQYFTEVNGIVEDSPDARSFMLKPGRLFAKKHGGRKLTVWGHTSDAECTISEKIMFTM